MAAKQARAGHSTISRECCGSFTATSSLPGDEWVGGVLSFGEGDDAPAITVTMRDERCSMVNLDPDSASPAPEVMKAIVRANQNLRGNLWRGYSHRSTGGWTDRTPKCGHHLSEWGIGDVRSRSAGDERNSDPDADRSAQI